MKLALILVPRTCVSGFFKTLQRVYQGEVYTFDPVLLVDSYTDHFETLQTVQLKYKFSVKITILDVY